MNIQIKYITYLVVIMMGAASCKKADFTAINTDPTSSTAKNFEPNYILTTLQLNYTGSSDFGFEVGATELSGAAVFIQHLASVSGLFYGDKYLRNPAGWGAYFDHAYQYQIKFAVDLVENTMGKPKYNNLYQIARIVKAMAFERLTDIYGDVPYSQAGLGYYNGLYTPKYDRQQDIYADLIKEVQQATDSLNDNGDAVTGDLFYSTKSDQIETWKRFGNTLLLRMAMRLTKVDPERAKSYVTLVQGKTMQGNADDAIVMHDPNGGTVTQNRIALYLVSQQQINSAKLSKPFVDSLKNNQDPRLAIIAALPDGTSDTAAQAGLPNGYDETASLTTGISHFPGYLGSLNKYSQPAPALIDYGGPSFILTYAESELLLADAAARWGIGDAASHYNNAVIAAMKELKAYPGSTPISDADAQAYLSAHPYDPANGLDMINTQFWIATFFNDYEAWSNWRRTGYPILTPVNYHGNVTGGTIPRRMAYPTSEQQSNGANYKAAVAASLPTGDNLVSRMWWDVQ